jgi:hypothetical protein
MTARKREDTTMADAQQTYDPDLHKGAVEGDRPNDAGQGNANAPALDENGLPDDPVAITEDVVGANEDETQG